MLLPGNRLDPGDSYVHAAAARTRVRDLHTQLLLLRYTAYHALFIRLLMYFVFCFYRVSIHGPENVVFFRLRTSILYYRRLKILGRPWPVRMAFLHAAYERWRAAPFHRVT